MKCFLDLASNVVVLILLDEATFETLLCPSFGLFGRDRHGPKLKERPPAPSYPTVCC